MEGRYKIIRKYFGLFESKTIFAVTDSLFEAVKLCEDLKRAHNGCIYSFDFEKSENNLHGIYDFDGEHDINCKNLAEYYEKKKELQKNEN